MEQESGISSHLDACTFLLCVLASVQGVHMLASSAICTCGTQPQASTRCPGYLRCLRCHSNGKGKTVGPGLYRTPRMPQVPFKRQTVGPGLYRMPRWPEMPFQWQMANCGPSRLRQLALGDLCMASDQQARAELIGLRCPICLAKLLQLHFRPHCT